MPRSPFTLALLALVTFSLTATAEAACSDVPAPGVEWVRCQHDGTNYRGIDLRGAHLRDSSFKRSDFTGAQLEGVDGRRIKLVTATLHDAVLDGANLVRADLTKADLSGASLIATDLRQAKLFRTILRDADLTGAKLDRADLLHADLSGALWIDGKTRCDEGSISSCHPAPPEAVADDGTTADATPPETN